MSGQHELGKQGEDTAEEFLRNKGYEIVQRHYRHGHGEIDIVAKDGDMLVFVEVKTRASDAYGSPIEAITAGKQRQLYNLAQAYLYERKLTDVPCRIDVIGIQFMGGRHEIQHIENAMTFML
ncbi:MAG: YraN family protein [Ectothiorhodospiraceae bacterium]|nr:YraN family protein [Ectothiorhodospiraceae bacterium]